MSAETINPAQVIDRLLTTPVEQRARVLRESGDASAILAALIEHAGRMTLADAARAAEATDVLVNLADRLGSQLDRARARRARARALSYAGKFREALFACEEGLRLAQEAGSAIDIGRTRLASMHALGELGRLDEAIAQGEAAREAFLSSGEKSMAARADVNIGTAHQRRDDPLTAIRCFDRARPLLLNEPAVLGPLDNNRGEALLAINDFAGAEAAFNAALDTFRQTHSTMAEAIVEGNLADLAARHGHIQVALFHFEQARRTLEHGTADGSEGQTGPHMARMLAERADAMSKLGMPAEALAEYERALAALDRHGLALEAARARSGMGMTLLRLDRSAAAETALAAAATAFDELDHATARAQVDLLRAELAARNGRASDARSIAMRALATLHDRPAEAAAARLLLGRLAMDAGRLDEAEAELSHALALAQQLDLAPLQADVLHQRGLLRSRRDDTSRALDDLAAALEQVERIRGTLHADRFRAAFLGDRAAMYESLAAALLDRAQPDDIHRAFGVIEQAKSRLLLDQMQRDLAGDDPAEPPASSDMSAREAPRAQDREAALLARLRRVRAELNALYSTLGDPRRRSDAPASAASWREQVRQREREVDELESRLATTRGVGDLFAATIDLAAAQQLVPDNAALVEYFTIGDDVLAFIVRRDRVRVHRRIASQSHIAARVQAMHFQINRALRPGATEGERGRRLLEDAQREFAAMGEALWQPIAHDIADAAQLIIVPHGVLHAVPFAALRCDRQYLVERHALSLAPSATLLQRTMSRQGAEASASSPAVVIGVADAQAPQIADEARLVAAALNCDPRDVLIDDRATVDRVVAAASRAALVHFACHGRYAPDSPMGSGLRLSDRWLTVRDMTNLRLNARLVALSGCETAVNMVKAGDELLGLLRGLFAAGAQSILASLWRVHDQITREWMTAFYGSLHTVAGPLKVAEAVRTAQLAVMTSHPHPAFWAPFVLAGRP